MSLTPLQTLQTVLSASLIERDAEVSTILLALVSREHVLFVGPPGVAKSLMCRSTAAAVDGMKYCERLLSPTTPPEKIFGPVSIKALREDRYEHVGEGTLQDCHLFFPDEVFRANDAIKDDLLHALGPERQVLVGTKQTVIPLVSAVGATNTWPDSAHDQAFFDRWLIRKTVKRLSQQGRAKLRREAHMLPKVTPVVNLGDIEAAHHAAMALPLSVDALNAMDQIDESLKAEGIHPSDRRWAQSVKVARSAAAIEGSSEVLPHHLEPLVDVLWDEPTEQAAKAADVIMQIANPTGARINELLREVDQMVSSANDDSERVAVLKKLDVSLAEAKKMAAVGNGRAAKCVTYIQREKVRMAAIITGGDVDAALAAAGLK